jgi:hypothetical protein
MVLTGATGDLQRLAVAGTGRLSRYIKHATILPSFSAKTHPPA